MAEIITSSNKRKGFSRKSRNHRSTRVDLTPMVDLGFLLITFFVFTTSLAEAKAMGLTESCEGDSKPVMHSTVMTIILSANHKIFYYYGLLEKGNEVNQLIKTDFKEIRSLIANKKAITDSAFLMYIIKADSTSTFGDNINLLDEMSICNIRSGHYAEVEITREEIDAIKTK